MTADEPGSAVGRDVDLSPQPRFEAVNKRYEVFADYFQCYLWNAGERPDPPADFTEDDIERRIMAAPLLIVIQPVRNMAVPVEIEIADAPPPLVPDDWNHIAEASIELPSGRLEIHECTGGSIGIIPVLPGTYRARACFGRLDSLSDDGLDGDDLYRISLWPEPFAPIEILKHHATPGSPAAPAHRTQRPPRTARARAP